jgi:hypothetical protein
MLDDFLTAAWLANRVPGGQSSRFKSQPKFFAYSGKPELT